MVGRLTVLVALSGCVVSCGSDESPPTAEVPIDAIETGIEEEDARAAVDAALNDSRLTGLLDAHAFTVAEVRTPTQANGGLVVQVEFDEPLDDDAQYPLDVCAIDTGGEPVTGVVWLIDEGVVSAVSPQWGEDTSCGY